MIFEFEELKSLQQMFKLMQEMRAEMKELKLIVADRVGKSHLSISEIVEELGYSDNTIKNWINQGRRHPLTRKKVKLPALKSEGGHYRIRRADLEVFKEIFTVGSPYPQNLCFESAGRQPAGEFKSNIFVHPSAKSGTAVFYLNQVR